MYPRKQQTSLHWRHNDHDGVSNHQPHGCSLNRLFRRRSKKTSKLRVTGLCVGNSPGPVNSPHKGPVTRKMFPFDDVIMYFSVTLCDRWCVTSYDESLPPWMPHNAGINLLTFMIARDFHFQFSRWHMGARYMVPYICFFSKNNDPQAWLRHLDQFKTWMWHNFVLKKKMYITHSPSTDHFAGVKQIKPIGYMAE